MNLQYRIDLLTRLGQYLLSNEPKWVLAQEKAERENAWFIPAFLQKSIESIALQFLQKEKLEKWIGKYAIPDFRKHPLNVGIVMAGNIPLVGFHDWLCAFVAGHKISVKLSSKDAVLFQHILDTLTAWEPQIAQQTRITDFLKGSDAYIATGSNNSAGYFEYYFAKYPHLIRRNRTSVAILDGKETLEELANLADDVHLYFGLGCRNVTKIYIPVNYDFVPLLETFRSYSYLSDYHKFKNNYDYNLAIQLLNKKYYMTNGTLLLIEETQLFSPISQLHYEFYNTDDSNTDLKSRINLISSLRFNPQVQTIVASDCTPFGKSQEPELTDYADGVDTMEFFLSYT